MTPTVTVRGVVHTYGRGMKYGKPRNPITAETPVWHRWTCSCGAGGRFTLDPDESGLYKGWWNHTSRADG